MVNVWGQDITYWYFPIVDDKAFTSLDTTQTPTIYVFDTPPTRTQAASGPGNIGSTISTWSWDEGRNGFSFTIPAITDPDPTSSTAHKTYYAAINHRLQAAAQVQTIVQGFVVERLTGQQSDVGVTLDDMARYFPQVGSCSSEPQRLNFIEVAVEDLQDKLKSDGYKWSRVTRPDRFKRVVTLRALVLLLLSQIQQGNDKFKIKYDELKQMYESGLASLQFEYDADGDGDAEETEVAKSGSTIFFDR